ncbi:DMT family transporter [Devosia neptuniae]|uniref:DMT family transporter n=1 Tax=Devosia neptuniae TaxID=191302 RepID=A0ABY6CEV3_9HYPH|nr:DMT family transporter [Devosia neptuniae]UXN70675.1 DMT family transporter [Devosia neptuniae]
MSAQSMPRVADVASLKGMALGTLAYSLFAVHDALVKGVIYDLPVMQILFTRSVVIAALCLIFGWGKLIRGLVASPNKSMMLLRAILTLAAWCMYYTAGRELQLAEMTTLYYFAPVLTTILAVIFLKEQLTLARVGAAGIGFFGVIVACNPAGLGLSLPAMLVLAAALCWAVAMILMRTISKTESSLVQIFSLNLFYVLVMGAVSLPFWQGMSTPQIIMVVATGLVGGTAQYLLVDAARLVPASVLGTVEYSALIWSFVFGYLFWREEPTQMVYYGALLVVAAGLMLAWNERRGRRVAVA